MLGLPPRAYKTLADVEYATAGWVDWYNIRRFHFTLGNVAGQGRASPLRCSQPSAANSIGTAETLGASLFAAAGSDSYSRQRVTPSRCCPARQAAPDTAGAVPDVAQSDPVCVYLDPPLLGVRPSRVRNKSVWSMTPVTLAPWGPDAATRIWVPVWSDPMSLVE